MKIILHCKINIIVLCMIVLTNIFNVYYCI